MDFRPEKWLADQWDKNVATSCVVKSRYNHYTGTDMRAWVKSLPGAFHHRYNSRFDGHRALAQGRLVIPTTGQMRKGVNHSARAAAVVAAAGAGQIETLFEIMWEEVQDFLYREFRRWRGCGGTIREILAEVCFIIRDMIRGTKMFKDYGHKIPIDRWADQMGKLLKNERLMNALGEALQDSSEEEEEEED